MGHTKTIKYLILAVIIGCGGLVNSQSGISEFRWNNRLLLLIDQRGSSNDISQQLDVLGPLNKDFVERKLLVLKVDEKGYQVLNNKIQKYISDPSIYKKYHDKTTRFNIVLIGLDGGSKLRQNQAIGRTELFSIIDSMPMRANEIKNKQK